MPFGLVGKTQGTDVLHPHTFSSEFIDKVASFGNDPYVAFSPWFGHLFDGAQGKRLQGEDIAVKHDFVAGQIVQAESRSFL